jgi:hypothetical protein
LATLIYRIVGAARGQAAQTAWDCRGASPGIGKSLATYKESYA